MTDTLYLLDSPSEITASFAEAGAQRLSPADILESYDSAPAGTRWVLGGAALDEFTRVLKWFSPSDTEQALLLFDVPEQLSYVRWQLLTSYFHTLILADRQGKFLPAQEMADVMTSEAPGDFVIGGEVDDKEQVVLLFRGTLERVPVPFTFFRPSGTGLEPDFSRFSVTDWGQTLKFGDYEASVESVLYDRDADFRKRAKQNRLKNDSSFGSAFRRLRLLRGLNQSSFEGISEREIRRIEKNEVQAAKIHPDTRRILERRLKVSFDEIAQY